jgi:hypothetical protein
MVSFCIVFDQLEALGPGPKPKTSRPAAQHRIYPYLLRGLAIDRPNQVSAADITDIPMARGFLYLVPVIEWYSRYVLAWRLSNTMDASFCLDALEDALRKGQPEIFNIDPLLWSRDSGPPLRCIAACLRVIGERSREPCRSITSVLFIVEVYVSMVTPDVGACWRSHLTGLPNGPS